MNTFNRLVAALLWLGLLAAVCYLAVLPIRTIGQLDTLLASARTWLTDKQAQNATNFLIGQVALGTGAVLVFGALLWLEVWPRRPKGVRIRTTEGGSAELEPDSIARRLAWHLDQLADVISVLPDVKGHKDAVHINLDIETAPDVDVAMKTDEVVEVTRDIVEQDMGLKLGKIDVRIRHAPFETDWVD